MRIAILANRANSFVPTMAKGLQRMLRRLGVPSVIFSEGLRMLWTTERRPDKLHLRAASLAKGGLKQALFHPYFSQLRKYSAVVVVNNIPGAFLATFQVEALRAIIPDVPIVNYDVHYLPTDPHMHQWLTQGPTPRGVGLERYDWYLMVSVVNEHPLPASRRQPISRIGLNLEDGTLFPQQGGQFMALLDFERGNHFERRLQMEALKEAEIPYVILEGPPASSGGRAPYTIAEMRQLYRRSGAFFVAARESFGLPIAEVQACGSYVLTPYAQWCAGHWIKRDIHAGGPGMLSPNFIVYGNNKEILVRELRRLKAKHDPSLVIRTFCEFHPHFLLGDLVELEHFVQMLRDKDIHSALHEEHVTISPLGDQAYVDRNQLPNQSTIAN